MNKPGHIKISKCTCGGQIVWLKTELGKNICVEVNSVSEGDDVFEYGTHEAHWGNCPDADKHRRRG